MTSSSYYDQSSSPTKPIHSMFHFHPTATIMTANHNTQQEECCSSEQPPPPPPEQDYPQRKKRRITMEDAFASLLSMSHSKGDEVHPEEEKKGGGGRGRSSSHWNATTHWTTHPSNGREENHYHKDRKNASYNNHLMDPALTVAPLLDIMTPERDSKDSSSSSFASYWNHHKNKIMEITHPSSVSLIHDSHPLQTPLATEGGYYYDSNTKGMSITPSMTGFTQATTFQYPGNHPHHEDDHDSLDNEELVLSSQLQPPLPSSLSLSYYLAEPSSFQLQDPFVSKKLNFERMEENIEKENSFSLPQFPPPSSSPPPPRQDGEQDMQEEDITSGADPMSTTSSNYYYSSSSSSFSEEEEQNGLSLLFAPRKKAQQQKGLDPVDERIEELIRHSRMKAMRMMTTNTTTAMTTMNPMTTTDGHGSDRSTISNSSASRSDDSSSRNRHKRKNAHMDLRNEDIL